MNDMKRLIIVWALAMGLPLLSMFLEEDRGGVFDLFICAAHAQTDSGEGKDAEGSNWWQRFLAIFTGNQEETSSSADQTAPAESVTDKYQWIYNLIHAEEQLKFDSLRKVAAVEWDEIHSPDIVLDHYDAQFTSRLPGKKVFGWHPYWMGSAYQSYSYKILTHVAWFSYNLDPSTGGYDNPEVIKLWKETDMVDLAHADSCKVLLTVSSHKEKGNQVFLDNSLGQHSILTDSLLALLEMKGADGIDLNFEMVPKGYSKAFSAFIKKLSTALKSRNADYLLTVSLPKVNRIYEIDELQEYVDFFIMTGYDYTTGNSSRDGPIAPLRVLDGPYSIEKNVFDYLEAGLESEKLLLGVPYYGGVWKSSNDDPQSAQSYFDRHITYREIKANIENESWIYHDPETWSAYYVKNDVFQESSSDNTLLYEKIWFEDTLTLSKKYSWVIDQNLGGIGIWALGYDNKHNELWNLLDSYFAGDSTMVYELSLRERKVFKAATLLKKYRDVFAVAGVFLVSFLFIGFVGAIFDWRVREVFFSNKTLRLIYIIGFCALILTVYALYILLSGNLASAGSGLLPLALGVALGAIAAAIGSHYFKQRRERMP